MPELRHLIVVLGDQLDLDGAAFDGFDATLDAVWMAEVADEATQVWSSKPRTALFLAAMRHFALALKAAGRPLYYTRLDAADNAGSLQAQLQCDIQRLRPVQPVIALRPGQNRILAGIRIGGAGRCRADLRRLLADVAQRVNFGHHNGGLIDGGKLNALHLLKHGPAAIADGPDQRHKHQH